MSSVAESSTSNLSQRAPMLDLQEIQATVLRLRPAPYFGSHVALHVDDAHAGRELLRRLVPHVDSASNWWKPADAWLSVAISYAGLEALRLPQNYLESFPEAFRVGMAARSPQLRDEGVNAPGNWEPLFAKGNIHIGLTAFSDSQEKWQRVIAMAR
jgi:deferrochelatase/peroxidase EfeB